MRVNTQPESRNFEKDKENFEPFDIIFNKIRSAIFLI